MPKYPAPSAPMRSSKTESGATSTQGPSRVYEGVRTWVKPERHVGVPEERALGRVQPPPRPRSSVFWRPSLFTEKPRLSPRRAREPAGGRPPVRAGPPAKEAGGRGDQERRLESRRRSALEVLHHAACLAGAVPSTAGGLEGCEVVDQPYPKGEYRGLSRDGGTERPAQPLRRDAQHLRGRVWPPGVSPSCPGPGGRRRSARRTEPARRSHRSFRSRRFRCAARMKAVQAARASDEPTLTRRTPSPARSATVRPVWALIRTFTGFGATASTIARMSSRPRGPGA